MRRAGRSAVIPLLLAAALALTPARSEAQQKKERSAAPEDRRGIAKGHERRARQRARPGSRGGAGGDGQLLWCGGIGKADVASGREMNCDTEFASARSAKRLSRWRF